MLRRIFLNTPVFQWSHFHRCSEILKPQALFMFVHTARVTLPVIRSNNRWVFSCTGSYQKRYCGFPQRIAFNGIFGTGCHVGC